MHDRPGCGPAGGSSPAPSGRPNDRAGLADQGASAGNRWYLSQTAAVTASISTKVRVLTLGRSAPPKLVWPATDQLTRPGVPSSSGLRSRSFISPSIRVWSGPTHWAPRSRTKSAPPPGLGRDTLRMRPPTLSCASRMATDAPRLRT